MQKRLILSLILVFLLSLPVFAQDDAFEATPCPVDMPFGFVEDTGAGGISCGFVTVPEFHAEPDGNQIRVAVAIIHSASPNPASDPLFMEQGGPGGSTIELFVQLAPLMQGVLLQRDIVLVEQRGTKYSDPVLDCPEFTDLAIEYISNPDSVSDAAIDLQLQTYQACFDRLIADGVNLSAFNSVENAADMIDVADALGYGQINFYGVSYGTMLGQHLLRDFEDRIRSIVFDAVVPLEVNFLPDVMATGAEARDALFASCATDDFCNSLYPDLESVLWETVADLNENPVLIPTTDPETGIEHDAFFNGDTLVQMLRSMQYQTEFIPSLPAFIYQASEGNFEWVEWLYGVLFIDGGRDIAEAMYTSVICGEDADFTNDDITTEGVEDSVVASQFDSISLIQNVCEIGGIIALDDYVDESVVSDVPALITSGEFDPITPERYADILAANLPNSTHLVFPGVGHGALLGGACPQGIIIAFINNPESDINSSCIDEMGISYNEFTTDPTGQLQFPIPQGFENISTDDFASYEDSERDIVISVIAIDEADLSEAANQALSIIIREDFDTPPLAEITQETGLGTIVNNLYQDGANLVLVLAQRSGNVTSVVVAEFSIAQVLQIDPVLLPIFSSLHAVD